MMEREILNQRAQAFFEELLWGASGGWLWWTSILA
jgi:hypothetical protein